MRSADHNPSSVFDARLQADLPFLAGGGEMGARMRAFDWSTTPLGPATQWPQSLRTAVSMCLNCRFPILLFWGPRCIHLYNDEYRSVLGSKHPALGKAGDTVWGEIWSTVGPMLRQVLEKGEATRSRDFMLPLARGPNQEIEEAWFSFSYSPIVNEEGKVAGVFCPVIETTETLRAQRRLQDEGGRLKNLFEQAPSFMAVLDGPDHVFALANRSYQDTFGSRRLIGRPVRQAFPELEGQSYFELLDHVYATGRTKSLRDAVARVRDPASGVEREHFIDLVYQPIRAANGSVGGIFVQGVDTTARKLSERRDAFLVKLDDCTRALSDAEEIAYQTMRLLCDQLGADRATYFEVDPTGTMGLVVRDYAPRIVSLSGRSLCLDDYGPAFARAMRGNEPLVLDEVDESALTPEQVREFAEIQIGAVVIFPLHKDGTLIALVGVYQGRPRRWQPEEIELVRLVVNRCWEAIGRARIARELRDADRRKDEFIATLAHELRNPLAPLRNSLAVLTRKAPGIPPERLYQMMERQVDHLVHMVDDLLDLSRITRGAIEIRRDLLDLAEPIRHAVETSRPAIESARHQLTVETPPAPVPVRGDRVRLTQIFANLLNNAAKYTPDGGRIDLSLITNDGQAVTRVTDNGIGIEAGMRGRVFEMFAQIPEERHRMGQGLGIGLSIVRSLVRQHGGTVSVHSPGRGLGSTFEVCLPLAEVEAQGADTGERAANEPLVRRRILVVDDNRDAADSIAMVLTTLGADVRVAYDGAQGLELAQRYGPDVAFLDIGMPVMDGHELARRIREVCSPGPRLVALTGWGQEADREASRQSGFDHHLIKPVRIEVVQDVLAQLLDRG